MKSQTIKRTYLTLLTFNTLSASFIWGINTLFLLDAGLNNTEAFAANAFFTAGMMIFEVPTGIVADMWGRKLSYLAGTLTLAITTLLYLLSWHSHASFWIWAIVSLFLGLGFTFFSGAFEAWLVDALTVSGGREELESVFARAQNLLKLYGNEKAYSIAGLAAAIIAASQIVGGFLAPYTKGIFTRRTSAMFIAVLLGSVVLALIGWTFSFWSVIILLIAYGLLYAGITPVRQMYLNGLIPSEQRATVLSFNSLMGSGGAVIIQPLLGRSADVFGYSASYIAAGFFQIFALPFIYLAYRERAPSDNLF